MAVDVVQHLPSVSSFKWVWIKQGTSFGTDSVISSINFRVNDLEPKQVLLATSNLDVFLFFTLLNISAVKTLLVNGI